MKRFILSAILLLAAIGGVWAVVLPTFIIIPSFFTKRNYKGWHDICYR